MLFSDNYCVRLMFKIFYINSNAYSSSSSIRDVEVMILWQRAATVAATQGEMRGHTRIQSKCITKTSRSLHSTPTNS